MSRSSKKARVLMLVENPFPQDVRVKNEAFALRSQGHAVSVIALRKRGQKRCEELDGVWVYRIPKLTLFRKTGKKNRTWFRRLLGQATATIGYLFEYFYFTFACLTLSLYISARRGFDVIHAHNPPDTLCLVGIVHKLFGKKFVFDHHDLSPELYLSRFRLDPQTRNIPYRMLLAFEKLSLRISTFSVATNESYKEMQVQRGNMSPQKVFVVRNGPDLTRVRCVPPDQRLRDMKKNILVYIGVMNPQDGVDYLLRALQHLAYTLHRDDFYCVLIGAGDSLPELEALSRTLRLEDHVWFTGYIPDEDLMRYLSTADICVDPNPSNPLNDVSTWIKVMEYMAVGKPVVSFDLKETRVTAQDAALYVPPNDELEFAKAVALLLDDPDRRKKMAQFGRQRIETHLNWAEVSKNLVRAYATLDTR